MDLGLKGKGVIVTGASKDIGRAIALDFAAEAANVAICARGQDALEKTVEMAQGCELARHPRQSSQTTLPLVTRMFLQGLVVFVVCGTPDECFGQAIAAKAAGARW